MEFVGISADDGASKLNAEKLEEKKIAKEDPNYSIVLYSNTEYVLITSTTDQCAT